MSASHLSDSSATKVEFSNNTSKVESRYALYLFSNNKHASNSGSELSYSARSSTSSSKSEYDEPSVCLSLLEGNLNAEQETVVRCYLLNTLSLREDLSFENEGKCTVLNSSDDSEESFGCYYHRLSKISDSEVEKQDLEVAKRHTFFVCLIGPSNGVLDSFCSELSIFCSSLISLLDPEGIKNRDCMQKKLKSWYIYSVEYIERCIKTFEQDIPVILHCSLWGNVEIVTDNEDNKWDLERFVETCSSLMPSNIKTHKDPVEDALSNSNLKLKEENGRLKIEGKSLESSSYCLKWFEKLKACISNDHKNLHGVLESFRLKTVQDLNSLKRLLQKAVNDHYALYRAFLFLQASGYEDILLYHVKKEAHVAGETEILDVITCLQEFIEEQHS